MADHVMIDVLNHGFHWRRRCHGSETAANRGLPFFCGCLRREAMTEEEHLELKLDIRSADGGDRTHTHLRELDFESSASANSATSAFLRRQ
jgi:hypothetical protein